MRLKIKVIPNARKPRITEENGIFKVYVNAPAMDGKANKAVIEALSKHFSVKKKDVLIVSGERSREKVVEIAGI